MYIHISFKFSTNKLLTNTKINVIYQSNIQKSEKHDHIIFFFFIFIIIIKIYVINLQIYNFFLKSY